MSVTRDNGFDKTVCDLRVMAEELGSLIQRAASDGTALRIVEENVFQHVLAIGHTAIDALLRMQGIGDLGAEVISEEGARLKRSVETQKRRLKTIFGEHQFQQYVYSEGANRKIDLKPIDARLSLSPHEWSYLLEEFSQMFCIESAFALASDHLSQVFGGMFSVDTLESISKTMGSQSETYLDDHPIPPPEEEGELLVASSDGKGVPLVREDAEKVKAFETQKLRPGNRRMATLGAVYSVDRYERSAESVLTALFRDDIDEPRSKRPDIRFKHVTAHFAETYILDEEPPLSSTGPIEAGCWIEREVSLRRKPDQRLLAMLDGDHKLWNTILRHLPSDAVQILDILHVSKYVWDAAKVFYSSAPEQEKFTRSRLLMILKGNVASVIRSMRYMAASRKLRGNGLKTITTVCNYFQGHSHRMRYDEYLRDGFPIATGVIEGACRHLVKDRMERSGMRWTLAGAKAMLNVRAIHQTAYLKDFHKTRIKQEQNTAHPNRAGIKDYTPSEFLAC